MNNSTLLVNLVFALGAAFAGAALSASLGQSVILGYILAGIAIGPFTPGFVGDIVAVQSLADIGIIFLLFAVGVQLSFRELLRVGKIAIVGGTGQMLAMIGLGYLVGIALGWRPLEALFFGAVISNSSSTVITKVLGDRGELGSAHGRISLAWSSIQDLGTVVLVVVLTALSTGGGIFLGNLIGTTIKAAVFLALLVPLGLLVLPWLFERVAAIRNREVFILAVVAIALGTAYASSLFGLSLALGAFIAGVVVGESELSLEILGETTPLRDAFAALFFVSVGMLVNPSAIVDHAGFVLLTLLLIVLGNGLVSATITALAGYPVRTAVLTGVALAQVAEFAFLLASLGTGLGVLSLEVFSLMLSGAALSIILSPSLHRLAAPLATLLEMRLSPAPSPACSTLPEEMPRDHAVILGYGRVGQIIASVISQQGFPFVVVDHDAQKVRQLRAQGVIALLGNAANVVILERAGLERARSLAVALPDALTARQVVDYAKRVVPDLDIVVRTHSWQERELLRRRGVGEVVMGELELAVEMTRHLLQQFNVDNLVIETIVEDLRKRIEPGPLAR